jgi:hypothetical protein
MRPLGTILIFYIAWHLTGCTRTEPSLVPLGRGPLSLAERELGATEATANRQERRLPPRDEPPRSTDSESIAVAPPTNPEAKRDRDAKADAGVANQTTTSAKDATSASNPVFIEAWLGLYRGNDTTAFLMPDQPDRRFDDPKAKIRVESTMRSHLTFALIDSSNGKDICTLSASIEGDIAAIDAGQPCFLDPDESMTVKCRPGKATRKDRRLLLDLVLDTTMDTEEGEVRGSIEYHFDGER